MVNCNRVGESVIDGSVEDLSVSRWVDGWWVGGTLAGGSVVGCQWLVGCCKTCPWIGLRLLVVGGLSVVSSFVIRLHPCWKKVLCINVLKLLVTLIGCGYSKESNEMKLSLGIH